MKNKIIEKRGISPIITTVLLIMVSIVAVLIVAGFIIPFIRDSLGESKDCFDVVDQLEINTGSGYTCYYNESSTNMIANLTVKRGTKEVDINGFVLAVSGGGSSKTFEIKEGVVLGVKMLSGSSNIEIPEKGEEMTYSINTTLPEVRYAEIAPIMKSGKICRSLGKAEIEKCQTF